MVLMAWSLCRLVDADRRADMLAWAACLVTTIPFAVLRSTGWMATSLNYYWPLAATLTAFIPLADVFWKRKTRGCMLAAAMICAVLGANQEQTAAVITGGYLVLGTAAMMKEKRFMPSLAAIFAIGLAELVIHLAAPGNAIRAELSVAEVNLGDYGQFSIVDQLSIGHRPLSAVCVLVFAIGFAARMVLSFSPTVVESGERTMLPFYGAMMLCALLCAKDLPVEKGKKWPMVLAFISTVWFAAMNVMTSFALAA